MPYRRYLLLKSLELFDLCVIIGALLLGTVAYTERMSFDFEEALSLRLKLSNVVLIAILLALSHTVLRANGLYESRRLSTRRAEAGDILKAVTLCVLMVATAAVAFKVEAAMSRSFLLVFWATTAGTLIASRILLRSFLARLRRQGHNVRYVLIVGTNPRALQMARRIESQAALGYNVLGFADDPWPGLQALSGTGYPLLSDLKHVTKFLRDTLIDEVLICLPLKSSYEHIRAIVEACECQGVTARLLGEMFDLRIARARVEPFDDETVVSLYTGHIDGWPAVAKRVFDAVAAFVLLILFAPLFLVTIVAIKLTSEGPAFFVQERVGANKRRFRLYKFRTMVPDAERRQKMLEALNEVSGPVFKIRDDPRITPLGRFLRQTSIDELPQLINVLKGDMSLVGPRPLPVRDCNGFEEDWHRRRFSVRPGITCLWQVTGRSGISFDRWMELDMQYIDQWSFWLDLKILAKTVPAVLQRTGAA